MQAFGDKALPVLVIDGEIAAHGHYASRDELAALLASDAAPDTTPAEKSSGYERSPDSCC